MAHNVETMFYARHTPWHRLSITVEETLSSEDALEMSETDILSCRTMKCSLSQMR